MYKDFRTETEDRQAEPSLLQDLFSHLGEQEGRWWQWSDVKLRDAIAVWLGSLSPGQESKLIGLLDVDFAKVAPQFAKIHHRLVQSTLRSLIEVVAVRRRRWTLDEAEHCLSALQRNGGLGSHAKTILLAMERSGIRLPAGRRFDILRVALVQPFSDRGDGPAIRRRINALFGVEETRPKQPSPLRDDGFLHFLRLLAEHLAELDCFRERIRPFPDIVNRLKKPSVPVTLLAQLKPPPSFQGKAHYISAPKHPDGLVRAGQHVVDWSWFAPFWEMGRPLIGADWMEREAVAFRDWESRFGDYLWLEADLPTVTGTVPGAVRAHLRSATGPRPTGGWIAKLLELDADEPTLRATLLTIMKAVLSVEAMVECERYWGRARHYALLYQRYRELTLLHNAPEHSALAAVQRPHQLPWDGETSPPEAPGNPAKLSKSNATVVKGAAWGLARWSDDEVVDALADAAGGLAFPIVERDRPQLRSLAAATACIWALGEIATEKAKLRLSSLQESAADPRIKKVIKEAITRR